MMKKTRKTRTRTRMLREKKRTPTRMRTPKETRTPRETKKKKTKWRPKQPLATMVLDSDFLFPSRHQRRFQPIVWADGMYLLFRDS